MENEKFGDVNGGESQTIEIEIPADTVVSDNYKIKEPIFIGHADPDILQKIEDLIDKDNFELAILSPQLQQNCRETYFFSKLGEKQRDDMLVLKNDKLRREQSLASINEVESMFIEDFKKNGIIFDKSSGSLITFKPYELKNIVNYVRKANLSNEKIREAIEEFQIHGFVTPTINNEVYHKQEFAITIDPPSRLSVLSSISQALEQEIELLKQRKQLYNTEILNISRELNEHIDSDDLQTEIKPVDKFRLNTLTYKQKIVLKYFKDNPTREYSIGEISKMYDEKSSSCKDAVLLLHKTNAVIEKLDEKGKSFYYLNPEMFNIED